ncbi:diaminopimelate decarboxylase [Ruminococcus sp. CAG:382]|nr:diaminopimelate decarboxylase [Ruminococcus sp. CAG:382]
MTDNNIEIKERRMKFAGHDVTDLADRYGTPLYLMDEARIRENCRRYTDCLDIMPEGSMILYAGKACCFKDMYRIITEEGMGADVVSSGELFTALSAGFDPSKLFFHGNGKTDTDLECAVNEGIGYIVCDNEDELYALSAVASYCRKTQKILLRLTPGIDPHTHKKIRTGGIDSKFGSLICDGTAERLAVAASHMDGVELCGFHCHIGSQIFDAQPFVDAAEIMSEFCAGLYRNHGIKTKILDLGGGFGVPYTDSDPEFDVKSTVRSIVDEVKRRFGDVALPAIMLEPGRSIVADAGLTVYTCTSVKNAGKTSYVAVDGGMPDNPRFALYEASYKVRNVTRAAEEGARLYTIAGRCCESGDLIQKNVSLPETKRGDFIAVETTGAYNYSMASNYNRLPRPAVIMLDKNEEHIVVRRETFGDILDNDL